MGKLSVGLRLIGLCGLVAANPTLSGLELSDGTPVLEVEPVDDVLMRASMDNIQTSDHRFSINGGTRMTITGSGFLPAGYDIGDASSLPFVKIYNTDFPDIWFHCPTVAHLLSDTKLVCQLGEMPLSPSQMGNKSGRSYRIKASDKPNTLV